MSFFCQASRFRQKNRTSFPIFPIDMSPGPGTYRARRGFEDIVWKANDVRSPDYVRRRKNSTQMLKCDCRLGSAESPLNTGESESRREPGDVHKAANKEPVHGNHADAGPSSKQDSIMAELYCRMMYIVKSEVQGLQRGIEAPHST